jgi:hypothetical protein
MNEVPQDPAEPLFVLYQALNAPKVIALIGAIVFVATVILTSIYTNILRDQSLAASKPFSLARSQLMWWTLIIGLCVIMYAGVHTQPPDITGTCLVLLGIGAATTMSARIIDTRQRDEANAAGMVPTHQDEGARNFFADILSDESGVSVHRFQSFAFNAIYGISFLYSFGLRSQFPEYNAEALALLGISSASYVGLKAFENKGPATPGAGQNDELLDANATPPMIAAG